MCKIKFSTLEKPADNCNSPVARSSTLASRMIRSAALPCFCSISRSSWKNPSDLIRLADRLTWKLLKASPSLRRNSRRRGNYETERQCLWASRYMVVAWVMLAYYVWTHGPNMPFTFANQICQVLLCEHFHFAPLYVSNFTKTTGRIMLKLSGNNRLVKLSR